MSVTTVNAADLASGAVRFDTVIDVRSPAEHAEDHLPGAVNWPVLDDDERRVVGTLYKQVSALKARKVGAAIVARNIAAHLERELEDRPRDWRPLVYCWRGGQRSGTMAWFLGQIGFRTAQLAGGYKAWRAVVREQLELLPARLEFRVLCGRTGSGTLAAAGAQVLDLEGLARHRGSVLGDLPGEPQPSQKRFDSLVWQALSGFDAARPVFVESESRRIGALRLPEALLQALRERAPCRRVELPDEARLDLLLEDYAHFAADAEAFCRQLDGLVELRGRGAVARWQALARRGLWREVFGALLREHYDPLYDRSLRSSFRRLDELPALQLPDAGREALREAAERLAAAPMA
jgi:tRNA 2-selenouridine synthase